MIINEKDIELSKPNRFPPITVKQGDNARQITARLFNDGEQFLVTSGLGVRLNAKRSDGQKNYSTGWVNDDGTVTVQITSWMLAVVGMVTCDISVFHNGQQAFTTTNFYLNVEEAINKDGVIGGDDTPVDEQFAEIVLQIEGHLNQARQYVEQARQYANQASTVDHIIEQNSGVPVKVWATDDKKEFDDLQTKQQNTLYIYPSVDDDIITPRKKLLWSDVAGVNIASTSINNHITIFTNTENLEDKVLEIEIASADNNGNFVSSQFFKFSCKNNGYTAVQYISDIMNQDGELGLAGGRVVLGINGNVLWGASWITTGRFGPDVDFNGNTFLNVNIENPTGLARYVKAVYEIIE